MVLSVSILDCWNTIKELMVGAMEDAVNVVGEVGAPSPHDGCILPVDDVHMP